VSAKTDAASIKYSASVFISDVVLLGVPSLPVLLFGSCRNILYVNEC
jgi:hypothetical protein